MSNSPSTYLLRLPISVKAEVVRRAMAASHLGRMT